jgi:hypothetical protein
VRGERTLPARPHCPKGRRAAVISTSEEETIDQDNPGLLSGLYRLQA